MNTTIKSKKGFYVGDICYVLDDEVYDGVWGAAGYEDGEYETRDGKFAVASTAYGDGEYSDNYGHEYGVDAGVLGIVPWEILEKQKKWKEQYGHKGESDEDILNYLGHFFEGTDATFYASGRGSSDEDGYFEVSIGDKTVEIHTGDEEEEDWDYSEDDYYSEDDDYPNDYYEDND